METAKTFPNDAQLPADKNFVEFRVAASCAPPLSSLSSFGPPAANARSDA